MSRVRRGCHTHRHAESNSATTAVPLPSFVRVKKTRAAPGAHHNHILTSFVHSIRIHTNLTAITGRLVQFTDQSFQRKDRRGPGSHDCSQQRDRRDTCIEQPSKICPREARRSESVRRRRPSADWRRCQTAAKEAPTANLRVARRLPPHQAG